MDIVTKIVKYNGTVSGRDKFCRFVQYSSKCGWYYLGELRNDKELVTKLKVLEGSLSATRKVLRFAKSLDMLVGAAKSCQLQNTIHRLCLTVSKLSQACYLMIDHILYLAKLGIIKVDVKHYGNMSARFWLGTLICNIARDLYDLMKALQRALFGTNLVGIQKKNDDGNTANGNLPRVSSSSAIAHCAMENQPIIVDTIKNVADLFLPLNMLGHVHLSPGVQGILGVTSSIAGILTVWNPTFKLSPS